ncbi:glycosyltransferase family A protein [Flavobacterium sp. UBA7663]|uniref:glycosyltransferase family A protein n=1 Tax=Flavobacterium sp. UBA7663 TaxID=1946557 RepID=UPI0025BDCC3E|nr:glycosyltransferase family 2 protein [Flavobacterium sp. UBA7663]
MITIFTPTYNRAHLLERLYKSLCHQSNKDFEWVIVDDGSVDHTETVIESFQLENQISIQFYKQENSGKHIAINKGVSLAKGELFFIVDSDDYLSEHAIEEVCFYFNKIKKIPSIVGVAGRRMYADFSIVGTSNYEELISNSLDIRYSHKVTGDLVEVFKTELLKKYPFPESKGEKFCPEALVWNRIALNYDLLFFNKGIYITEYLEGGLTSSIVKIRMQSPKLSTLYYAELEHFDIPFFQKLKANINFWRFSFNVSKDWFSNWNCVSVFNSIIGLPTGFFMYLNDKRKL